MKKEEHQQILDSIMSGITKSAQEKTEVDIVGIQKSLLTLSSDYDTMLSEQEKSEKAVKELNEKAEMLTKQNIALYTSLSRPVENTGVTITNTADKIEENQNFTVENLLEKEGL